MLLTDCVTGLEQDKLKLTKLLSYMNKKLEKQVASPQEREKLLDVPDPDKSSSDEDFFDASQDPSILFGTISGVIQTGHPPPGSPEKQVELRKDIPAPNPANDMVLAKPTLDAFKITSKAELFDFLQKFDPVKYVIVVFPPS
jgi:hypothetical protein